MFEETEVVNILNDNYYHSNNIFTIDALNKDKHTYLCASTGISGSKEGISFNIRLYYPFLLENLLKEENTSGRVKSSVPVKNPKGTLVK